MAKHIDIGKEFSPRLGPRFKSDGEFSGEVFRDTVLEPALQQGEVVLHLDSLQGYGASFLEEVFGGVVRKHGYAWVNGRLQFASVKRPYLIARIKRYMNDAEKTRGASGGR